MIIKKLNKKIISCVENLFSSFEFPDGKIQIVTTKKEFEGDITLVLFPLLSLLKKSPSELGKEIGNELMKNDEIDSFNIVSGFLNLVISDSYINNLLESIYYDTDFGTLDPDSFLS